jgi:hypothetical protein
VDAYAFPSGVGEPQALRARVFLDQRVSGTLQRVYRLETDDPLSLQAVRHTVSPFLRWSYAPEDLRSEHPFFDLPGAPRFDLFDPNSDLSNLEVSSLREEQRLREHHLLSAGLTTRLVGRFGTENREYREFLAADVSRDLNIRDRQFSRFRLGASGGYLGIGLSTRMSLDPSTWDADFRNEISYGFRRYVVRAFQVYEADKKNFGVGAEARDLGPLSLSGSVTYDELVKRVIDQNFFFGWKSSSKCWFFNLSVKKPPGQEKYSWTPLFGILITEKYAKSFSNN